MALYLKQRQYDHKEHQQEDAVGLFQILRSSAHTQYIQQTADK
jgi:hypothetical protein